MKSSDKIKKLISINTLTTANVWNEAHTEKETMNNVITSDTLVDIFYELYPVADELDERYDDIRAIAESEGLTIVPGEDIAL